MVERLEKKKTLSILPSLKSNYLAEVCLIVRSKPIMLFLAVDFFHLTNHCAWLLCADEKKILKHF